ncbi:MAG: poly-gamma-glutamate biosynthesis protein PgsC/CapC, partial [Thiotrichaceae bacterium]|nr:poly-gamma-glutamate biosynthesis protein PgsC/CapC [Thiotrichaceae bacterium]
MSAPKAYIIVVVTALIASRMNLRYSWDFNGILIPALLALQWYQPYKILTSFIEAFIILFFAQLVLPLFKSLTIEGARKLLLFFNVGFIYKMALGYFRLWFMPSVKMTDYYAFGYLLSTLMALKMHDKNIVLKMTRGILQVSLVGVLVASILGFSMTFIPNFGNPFFSSQISLNDIKPIPQTTVMELINKDRISLYQGNIPGSFVVPLPHEIEYFKNGVENLLAYQHSRDKILLQEATVFFAQVNYQVLLVQQRYIYLREIPPRRNWGVYVLDLETDDRLLIEVPAPLDEKGMMETGAILFMQLQGRALAIAGSARAANKNGASDMLLNYHSFFQVFHHQLAHQNVLQVRAYTPKIQRIFTETMKGKVLNSSLWVKRTLPAGLDLSLLEQIIGRYVIEWRTAPLKNIQQNVTVKGFSELFLTQDDAIRLFLNYITESVTFVEDNAQRIDGY